jgi:hypothetical protein
VSEAKKMIDEFVRWHEVNAQRFQDDFVSAQLRQPELATTPQAAVNFQGEHVLASISIWGSGDFEVIIVCKRDNKVMLVNDLKIPASAEVFRTLDGYYRRIATHPPC